MNISLLNKQSYIMQHAKHTANDISEIEIEILSMQYFGEYTWFNKQQDICNKSSSVTSSKMLCNKLDSCWNLN